MKTENIIEKNVGKDVTPEKSNTSKRKKAIIIIVSVFVALFLVVAGWCIYEYKVNEWDVKDSTVTIEYGEKYNPSLDMLVDTTAYPNVTGENTNVECDIENENDKEYPAVGEYEIIVKHNIEYKLFGVTLFSNPDSKKIALIVKDTIAPEFVTDANVNPKEIEFVKDCKDDTIINKYKADDLSEVAISLIDDKVDYSTIGEYEAVVVATDKSGNKTETDIKVKVVEPTIHIEPTSLNIKVDDTATLVATVNGKDKTVQWSSSDESVASVDNGKVTAKKAGTTTITGKANEKESNVSVTVEANAVGKVDNNTNGNENKGQNTNTSNSSNNNSTTTSQKPSSNNPSSNSNNNTTVKHCTNNNNHSMDCGGIGKWFNSRDNIDEYWLKIRQRWGEMFEQVELFDKLYEKLINFKPSGYESWSCAYCGKWTGNFKYSNYDFDVYGGNKDCTHNWDIDNIDINTKTGKITFTCTTCGGNSVVTID